MYYKPQEELICVFFSKYLLQKKKKKKKTDLLLSTVGIIRFISLRIDIQETEIVKFSFKPEH